MLYHDQNIKQKKPVLFFFATLPLVNILLEMGKNIFFEETWDVVLRAAAEPTREMQKNTRLEM